MFNDLKESNHVKTSGFPFLTVSKGHFSSLAMLIISGVFCWLHRGQELKGQREHYSIWQQLSKYGKSKKKLAVCSTGEATALNKNRQEKVSCGSACFWRRRWKACSETEDAATWCSPVRTEHPHLCHLLQKLDSVSSICCYHTEQRRGGEAAESAQFLDSRVLSRHHERGPLLFFKAQKQTPVVRQRSTLFISSVLL